ncbi:hypothetical protein D3C81_1485980 [compost metagenome]
MNQTAAAGVARRAVYIAPVVPRCGRRFHCVPRIYPDLRGAFLPPPLREVLALSLVFSRMDTEARRCGRIPMRRASTLNVTRALSSLSSHSSLTVRPSTRTRMPFWYSVAQCSASRFQSSTGAQ